ncbi:MAG: hypothetical protein HQK53_19805 [Oligoflexia bacterium]|nr:hypothetical protein [Oligoflexia bacterium]
MTNDPVKSTRVRIFLLQAIARKLREADTTKKADISVSRYSDTPTITFRREGRVIKQMSFVEAVTSHGRLVSFEEIAKARRIAGQVYTGVLENYFIIVPDVPSGPAASASFVTATTVVTRGEKRPFTGGRGAFTKRGKNRSKK